jgi:peptide/nickel transport system permease protein
MTAVPTPRGARRTGEHPGWYRFRKNRPALIGLGLVLLIGLATLLAPWIAPYPHQIGPFVNFSAANQPPSWAHLMGTDTAGRDVLTRVLFGYRTSFLLMLVVLGIGVPLGVLLGLAAGYFGGWTEAILMRLTDVFLALPPLAVVLAVTSALAPSLGTAMLALAALWWTWYARLVHGLVRSIKKEDFILAARRSGASTGHILFREILPNIISTIAVKITLDAGFVILLGAGLSFLGLGARPPTPDLGTMVADGANYLPEMWWEAIFPGFAILVLILGFNLLGDGLRDYFDVEVL